MIGQRLPPMVPSSPRSSLLASVPWLKESLAEQVRTSHQWSDCIRAMEHGGPSAAHLPPPYMIAKHLVSSGPLVPADQSCPPAPSYRTGPGAPRSGPRKGMNNRATLSDAPAGLFQHFEIECSVLGMKDNSLHCSTVTTSFETAPGSGDSPFRTQITRV
jgi:hypothetical protein